MVAVLDALLPFLEGVFSMSLTGSAVILVLCLLRLCLKRAPKIYSYWLWAAAGFRLICPVSLASFLSIFNMSSMETLGRQGPVTAASYLPSAREQLAAAAGALDWALLYRLAVILYFLGVAVMLAATAVSCLRLQNKVRTAVRLYGSVYECEGIPSPFVQGFLKPKIYIPFGLDLLRRDHVLSHEACHIRRRDHLVKPLAWAILCLHWFNPLVWLAFALMTRDMEMSCDERVLSQLGIDARREYSLSLLSLGESRSFPNPGHSIAFGESNIKERVTNVMKYHPIKRWAAVLAAVICILAIAACSANPADTIGGADGPTGISVTESSSQPASEPVSSGDPEEAPTATYSVKTEAHLPPEGSPVSVVVVDSPAGDHTGAIEIITMPESNEKSSNGTTYIRVVSQE